MLTKFMWKQKGEREGVKEIQSFLDNKKVEYRRNPDSMRLKP